MARALLVILDGYGISEDASVSAIEKANKPFLDSIFAEYPHSYLTAEGESVGLPDGQFGNSEVGHLNIGAGRIVWQELSRINKDIREEAFFSNPSLLKAVSDAKKTGRLHLMGLFSDGGVHSHIDHLYALLELCKRNDIPSVYVHAFTDGRDTKPHSGVEYARAFKKRAAEIGVGELASIIGRYYAMDRDNRWERVEKAYQLLVHGEGSHAADSETVFLNSYSEGITDEFINPHVLGNPSASRIKDGDTLLFFNFRGDRAREITSALTADPFDGFERKPLHIHYYTFTQYDERFTQAEVVFKPVSMVNTLGEVVAKAGKKQLRIAETEKYPHVTYFFNGGDEKPNEGEDRILVASPKVATYDLQPEMSAPEVTEKLVEALKTEQYDLVVLNFANPDMVGHTGDIDAAAKAVEAVDACMKEVVTTAREHSYSVVVIADHGNADVMIQEDGSAHTAHTLAKVPFLLISNNSALKPEPGILADVAPTLLKLMEIDQPKEMTGRALV
ncbi:MAG: 2,3-bisphosphoglycerate-independent phosphoglycerate mutase [Bacteroidetes bacterium]|nr:2,3-bisphosphoglycerate-independent phosphoglycerate mutase [Bacteroidota bacterium]MCH8524086.1 2,3-bisphosphoglycerate-independent phosphoglycerate mutase [Balneolales bacterium]